MLKECPDRELSCSIVLYHSKLEQVLKAIKSFLNTSLNVKLYLVDNSLTDDLRKLGKLDDRIEYIFNNSNLGYGSAHNVAIRKSIVDEVPYHLILNPDVYFEFGVLEKLFEYMETNQDVGHIMPKVLYPNGELQYLTKLIPTPIDLISRRFNPFKNFGKDTANKYELRFSGYDKILNVPYLSGCFMFLRIRALKDVGLFDERFFMYPEDIDLTRRIHRNYKTIYYPIVSIVHEHEKASSKNFRMFAIHAWNMIKYFNKWGWLVDYERSYFNYKVLKHLNYSKHKKYFWDTQKSSENPYIK